MQHLPPRKRLAAAMMANKVASLAPAGKRPHLDASTSAAWRTEDVASRPAWARPWPSNKPRAMIPESDVIREARARARGGRRAAVSAQRPAARRPPRGPKADAPAAARQVAIAKAEAAKAAAKEAKELARLAEEAKHTAEDLERERSKRRDGGSAKAVEDSRDDGSRRGARGGAGVPHRRRARATAALRDERLAATRSDWAQGSARDGREGERGRRLEPGRGRRLPEKRDLSAPRPA